MLEIRDLTVNYGDAVLALDGVSLEIAPGAAVALLGANGAGKSTLLRAISGLLSHHGGRSQGSIRFLGEEIAGADAARLVGAGIGQSLEGRRIFPQLSVAENLQVGAFTRHARGAERERKEELLNLFPILRDRLEQPGGLLSGGEQQMLAIARALMSEPQLLLLDEPSLGLAPRIVFEIGEVIERIRERGVTILIVDQSTALSLHATEEAYLIEHGRIRAHGPTRDLLGDDQVLSSYLGTAGGKVSAVARGVAS